MNQGTVPSLGDAAMQVMARSYAHTAGNVFNAPCVDIHVDRYYDYLLDEPFFGIRYHGRRRAPALPHPAGVQPDSLPVRSKRPRLTARAHEKARKAADVARKKAQKKARKRMRRNQKR
ncbi:MAG TPA: hypothetical protein VHO23_01170 [Candidatus Paceibacterota bacterium]|nr:hypothetical protein [Candidatus Paceibacterota bacterium]